MKGEEDDNRKEMDRIRNNVQEASSENRANRIRRQRLEGILDHQADYPTNRGFLRAIAHNLTLNFS